MAPLNLIFAAFKRTALPEAVTVNCLVERDPTSLSEQLTLRARPGSLPFKQVGTAPIRALWQRSGLFAEAALVLASNTVYSLTANGVLTPLTGMVPDDNLVDIEGALDGDDSIARIANGTGIYLVKNGTVTQEAFPEGAGVTSVSFISGYWLAVQASSDFMYYLPPGVTTWEPLEFAAAEYGPDPLVAVRAFGEQFALLGSSTTEFWRLTGDNTSPLAPVGGLKFDFGCRARSAAVNCSGTLIWVDNNCSVRMTEGGEPVIISDDGLAEQIRKTDAMDLRASFFIKDQHPVYVLTLGSQGTWLYDLAMKAWTRANSDTYAFWRADLFCNIGDVVLARDSLSNFIYRLEPDLLQDGDHTFTMEFCAYLESKEQNIPVGNVWLHAEMGGSPRTGQGSAPLIGMQTSRDGTKTWGQIRTKTMGVTGAYRNRVRWNGCGMAEAPLGMWFKFYISDPIIRRISGGAVNAP